MDKAEEKNLETGNDAKMAVIVQVHELYPHVVLARIQSLAEQNSKKLRVQSVDYSLRLIQSCLDKEENELKAPVHSDLPERIL